jgi:hypothetical protein
VENLAVVAFPLSWISHTIVATILDFGHYPGFDPGSRIKSRIVAEIQDSGTGKSRIAAENPG